MNKRIAKELASLEIYKVKAVSKKDYYEWINNSDENFIFYEDTEHIDSSLGRYNIINTMGYTTEEIKLMLEIDKAKNIRSIKSMITFFVVLTIISMALATISLMGMLL